MKNILFVSIAFPPKSDAEGLQVAKYLKYLVRSGEGSFAIDAVTSALPTLNMPIDISLEPMLRGVRQTVELPIYENRYSNFLIRKVLPWAATMPDPKFTFHLQLGKVIRQLQNKPDLIYSRSFPLSSAVLAYNLKRTFGIPWVMHMSDIWADCPERSYRGLSRAVQERMERKCFEAADTICVTSEKTRTFYQRKYPHLRSRIEHFPNVFDLEDLPTHQDFGDLHNGKPERKFRIVHTGSLVGGRSADPLLAALSQLEQSIQENLEVLLVGPLDNANSTIIQRWNLPFVTLCGQVEYQESLRIQRSADLLVLIDMPVKNPDLRVYFPSKLLDYVIAGPPILAIGDEGSEIQQAVRAQALGDFVERGNIAGLARNIDTAIRYCAIGKKRISRPPPEIYNAEYNAERLLSHMKKLLNC
jgi:glycosyltransferase involved in cell wall biosynthesis